jgi:dolichol-phosphate mannosyltransferase
MKKITVVIPVYQNAGSIELTCKKVSDALNGLAESLSYDFVLVNDGSSDGSWEVLKRLKNSRPDAFTIINFSRNFGQISALLAGYREATGDCLISMAADMQDPPELVTEMAKAWMLGNKLVVASRETRNDGLINDTISNLSWSVIRRFALKNLPSGGFDYFLMDREIINYYIDNPEQHIFLQGRLLYCVDAPYVIPYERQKRVIGKSQTTLAKKIKYLIDGFTGYSFAPLRFVSLLGISVFCVAILASLYIIWYVLTYGTKVEGWASLMVVILFLSGIQLLALGIIGEYLWRSVEESRKRPHYIIKEKR